MSENTPRAGDVAWSPLYRIAGASAGLAVLLYGAALVIVSVTAAAPVSGGAPLLEYIGAHRTLYIVRQVLWLCPSVLLMVVFLALVVALRHQNRSLAAIAGLIGVTSWALSLAWPTTGDGSLALVLLSDGYAAAATAAGKAPFVAGAEVLIALNDVPAVIGVLQTLGVLLISLLMLRSAFSARLAWFGLMTGVIGVFCELLRPVLGWTYAIYGVLLFAWLGWIAVALLRLGRSAPR
ncbi:hypothetical protein [Nonomuraea harbinensis]|uniref:DUF4386 family protein n=1 Tax=Nonomuraea harbinensis TaxID=1286938 RepID=A0ABW1CAD2_9ACTN|nr:hypothetical protein [Nonomuraea harbinensis]